jgi:hypothetical protein
MSDSPRARLSALRPKIERVEIPEAPDAEFYVRGLNGRERSILISKLAGAREAGSTSDADIVVLGVCAADGTRLYTDAPEDLAEVEQLDGIVLSRLSLKIVELAGLTAKAAENAEKN